MMMRHVISNEVICVTVDVPGNGVESDKENMFREEGEAEFELMSMVVTVTIQKKFWEGKQTRCIKV